MTEPETIISNNSKYVLWGESDFLVSMDYLCYTEKQ
jgi:hypothetical protein